MSHTISAPARVRDNFESTTGIKPVKPSAGVQYAQNTENLTTKTRKPQSVWGVDKILKTCVYQGKGIHPRRFCRRWFGLEDLDENGQARYTENLILAMESEHGYREKCINVIARVLKIKPNTVHRWGKGVEFDKIPVDKREQYEVYLGYIDSLRVITLNLAGLNEDLLLEVLRRLEFK
jgi:hypothetical protein